MDNSVERNKRIEELRERVYQAKQKGYSGLLLNLDDVILLFEEYDDERASHNSHVTELCEAEKEIKAQVERNDLHRKKNISLQAELSRLQVERDKFKDKYETEFINAMNLLQEKIKLVEERDKAITWLRGALSELDRLGAEAWNKWEKEADMHAQGEAGAYDTAEQMVEAILSELGVSHDPLD